MEVYKMTERTRRMLADLDERARPYFEDFFNRLDSSIGDGQYIAFEGRRTLLVQEAYHAQGRETLEIVNKKRAAAGLYLLRSEKDNYIITWTLKSKHIDGPETCFPLTAPEIRHGILRIFNGSLKLSGTVPGNAGLFAERTGNRRTGRIMKLGYNWGIK